MGDISLLNKCRLSSSSLQMVVDGSTEAQSIEITGMAAELITLRSEVQRLNAIRHTETRTRHEPAEPVPEGWRYLRSENLFGLFTNAPLGEMPQDYETKWIEYLPYTEMRTVTGWVR